MCSPARCRRCGRTTWSGCGRHAEQVLASVPQTQRCVCEPEPRRKLFGLRRP